MAPPSVPHDSTIFPPLFSLSNGTLSIKGIPLLTQVPANVSLNSFSSICTNPEVPVHLTNQALSNSHKSCFLGFTQTNQYHLLKNPLGQFTSRQFLSIFRFKTWWSTMWVGSNGSDLQMETQWVLFKLHELNSYALLVPLIEGSFRSALHPGSDNQVMIWAESGSTHVQTSSFKSIAYFHFGTNPYILMKEAFTSIRVHLNTFRLLEEKSVPGIVDKFGWCTWDAFYLTVDPLGVFHGVKDFEDSGFSVRFLIIDDGWQSIDFDGGRTENLVIGGQQMNGRLYRLEECDRFRKYRSGSLLGPNCPSYNPNRTKMLISKQCEIEQAEKALNKAVLTGYSDQILVLDSKLEFLKKELDEMFNAGKKDKDDNDDDDVTGTGSDVGLKAFTRDLRVRFKRLDDIYVWQALCGAWGGVRPAATQFDSKVIPVKVSPGLKGTMEDLAVVKLVEGGIGLVHPDHVEGFYDAMHSYLSNVGITGAKVDVIHSLEYVSEDYGGRVKLAKTYYEGLSKSLLKNFKGTGLISSMQQCNDFFFLGTSQISFGRAGDDFWFQDPNGDPAGVYWLQGVHIVHCAYNSLWMGQMIHPDWDMFQSDHCCAKFHAGSRAISGGPIYLSDSVGFHDFSLIKQLVFPDGTIPKCTHFALPTRDCLFTNPLFDGETILKLWNLNKYGGVIGAFNCQGAGWDPEEHRLRGYSQFYRPVSCSIHLNDIEWEKENEEKEYAVYLNQAENILLMTQKSDSIRITIHPSSFEIFSFMPITTIVGCSVKFAPIGLSNMFNTGGTILKLECIDDHATIKVKGVGRLLVYSSDKPKKGYLNGADVEFEWFDSGKLELDVYWVEECDGVSEVLYQY